MTSLTKTLKSMLMTLPILVGMVLLIGLFQTVVNPEAMLTLFRFNEILNSFVGASLGAIAAGNPITSYILGGEMLEIGIGIVPVVAFIIAWVTVGIVQLPAEIMMLGKRFAIIRNVLSFISAILIGILTYVILQIC